MNSTQDPFGSLMSITVRPNIVFVRGSGSWLFDSNGKKYFDAVQGWAVNCLGHSPEPLVEALCRQAKTLISPSPAYYNQPMMDLADRLTSHSCFDKVFFANCGAEANEGAVKLARKYGATDLNGAYEIITFDHGFHGRTLAMMSASGKPQWDALYEPKVPGFKKANLNDMKSVIALKTDKTVAVMLEPIQGEAGVLAADDSFLVALRQWTKDNGLLLIFDEVQTGMGRTGKLFCYEHSGIEPDVMTLGKGVGGGIPLAALLAKESVCRFQPGDQGGTYNGNPLMTAGGVAVFDVINAPGFIDRVVSAGRILSEKIEGISKRLGFGAVRGKGLLLALDLKQPVGPAIVSRALELGLLLNSPRPDTLRLMPALNITDSEIDALTGLIETAASDVLKTVKA